MDKKICILLPTCSGRDKIKYFFDALLPSCKKNRIDLCVCDSSPSREIEELCLEYQEKFPVVYILGKLNPPQYGAAKTPDYKIFAAMNLLAEKYQYIWLVGDNCILKLDELFPTVEKYMAQNADIIHFSYGEEDPQETDILYRDAIEFYKDDAWHVTAYGASVVSSRLIRLINKKTITEKYTDSGFMYVMSLYETIAENPFLAVHCRKRQFFTDNPLRGLSGWIKNGTAIEVFAKQWTLANEKLPAYYDSVKKETIRSHSQNTGLFWHKRSLCILQCYHTFSWKKLRENKEYLKIASDIPTLFYYFLACCPPWLARLLCKMKGIQI